MPKPSLTQPVAQAFVLFSHFPNVGTQLSGGSVGIRSSLLGKMLPYPFITLS
jgi:hypothetical protein